MANILEERRSRQNHYKINKWEATYEVEMYATGSGD